MKIVRQVLQEYLGKVDQLREALSCTLYLRIDFLVCPVHLLGHFYMTEKGDFAKLGRVLILMLFRIA